MVIKKLAGQTVVYGLSTIIPKVINYLLTPYLTYIALSKTDFGVIGYFYAVIPFVFSILLMGMETGFFRFVGKDNMASGRGKEAVYTTIWSSTVLFASIFFLLVLLFQDALYGITGGGYHQSIIGVVAGIILVDVIAAIPFSKLRESDRAIRFASIKAISVIFNVLLVVLFYSVLPMLKDSACFCWMWIDDYGSGYFFISNLLSSILGLVMVLCSVKTLRLSIDRVLLIRVLRFSVPLFIGGLTATANEFLDRFLIRYLMPESVALAQLGVYSATVKLTAIMVIFTQMYRYAAEPLFLARLNKSEFKENNALVTTLFVLVSIIIFLVITLFLDVFKYIIAPEFRDALDIVPLLLISSANIGILLNLNFWYKYVNKTHFAILITAIGFAVSVGLNFYLIPLIGLKGAAIAKLVSTLLMVFVSYYLNQRHYPINYRVIRIVEYVAVAAMVYFIAFYANFESTSLEYIFKSILLIGYTIYAIKREKILLLLKG